ncbi:MAG: hypothetical protein MN733_08955, partial [Nitrososphaera sp.]|nr:hypothetical protein [Nitrososphaera sp.]
MGFGDPKRDLGPKALDYISARAYRLNEKQRERLREKVWIMDVTQSDHVTPYNILACQHMSAELLVNNRIEMICKMYGRGSSAVTTRMKSILKHVLLLMVEFKLPITLFERLCMNTSLIQGLAAKSKSERLRHYFAARFPKEPKGTVLGLCQRIDSLCNISEGVRLSLSASSAPDFQKLQDDGYLVVMNVSGPGVSRRTSDFLMQILVSDIQQSVFRRQQPDRKYIWCLDESQLLMRDAASLENLIDLVTMSRSFSSYFVLLSQALTSAVGDVNHLNAILQNLGWCLLFRSTVREAKIISPAIPLTGMMLSKKRFLYDEQKFLTKDQELNARLEEITHFENRMAYL